jgi:hypothetical protein
LNIMVRWISSFVFVLSFCSVYTAEEASPTLSLRYKPRLQESVYSYFSRAETLFTNVKFQKYVASNSQAYIGLKTLKTLENGHLVQKAEIQAGNISVNDQVYAHPAAGQNVEYVLAPWGGIPKAMGTGHQFQVKSFQLVLPKEPISIGSTWTVTIPSTPTFPLDTSIIYEVTNILGALVIIHARVDTDAQKVGSALSLTMKGSSQLIFNAEEGLLIRNESNQFVELRRPSKKGEMSTKMNVNSILELQF